MDSLVLRTHPNVKKAIVLDLPEVVANAKAPEDLENRLEYANYNFLTEKVTHHADAYVFRHISMTGVISTVPRF